MAAVKFGKGSTEWQMFTEFWQLCQKYWQIEDSEEYWNSMVQEVDEFSEKYKGNKLAKLIGIAFLDAQDSDFKKNNR